MVDKELNRNYHEMHGINYNLLNLLSSIMTILLTCPNSDTLLCYSNDPFLTVYTFGTSVKRNLLGSSKITKPKYRSLETLWVGKWYFNSVRPYFLQ